jgi:hypothetical protein
VSRQARRRRWWPCLALVLTVFIGCAPLAGCSAVAPTDSRKLQARATYERALSYLQDRQATMALGGPP